MESHQPCSKHRCRFLDQPGDYIVEESRVSDGEGKGLRHGSGRRFRPLIGGKAISAFGEALIHLYCNYYGHQSMLPTMMNVTILAPIDLAGANLGIEVMVFQGLAAFPCCDSFRSPCLTASLYLSVWARFRLPRPPSSRRGGAVDAGGRVGSSGNKRKIVRASGRNGGARRGYSGLGRWANMIVDPP